MSHARTASSRLRALATTCAVALLAGPLAIALPTPAAQAETPPLSVKVNFQPDATAVPAGFTKDTGAAYTDATGSGWVRQDSLSGTRVPFGVPLNTRDRNLCTALTPQQRTFLHMQAPVTNASNNGTPVAWEYALPDGDYAVTVGVGDANLGQDAESHTLNVEGVNVVKAFPRSAAANCTASRLTTGTATVRVTDGKLTVDAIGGTNTKLQYVTIDDAPDAVTGLQPTPTATGIDLDWADGSGVTGYRVFRSTQLPVATTGTPLASPSGSSYSDTTAVKGQVYYYAVQAVSAAGLVSLPVTAGAVMDDAQPAQLPMPVRVNFTRQGGTAVPGHLADSGQNFANVRGYGWVVPGTGNPLDLVGNGRERAEAGLDKRLDTLVHMQADDVPAPSAGTVQIEGAWELAVPNGTYDVELSVGDASVGGDPTSHEVNVEGRKAVDDFRTAGPGVPAPTGAARFRTGTLTGVAVTDGRLTVDAAGGTNTKINYITVTPTPADAVPAAPSGLTATAGDASVALDWADSTESDVTGYDVFRSTTATVATTGTPLNGSTPLTASAFTDTTAANGTTYRYAVVAVDAAGQRSPASATASAAPDAAAPATAALPLRLNFQDEAPAPPATYTREFGQAFTNSRGYGWVEPGTSTPRSLVGNGRTRAPRAGTTATLEQRTLLHVQGDDVPNFNGVPLEGAFEVALPDGRYAVTASVGDQPGSPTATCAEPCYDSKHRIVAEGTVVVDEFQATAGEEFRARTATVQVTDGRLTVTAAGGTNTKINYLVVEPADTTAPAAVTGLAATAGDGTVALRWDASSAPDLAGYRVYRAQGSTVETTEANRVGDALVTGTTLTDPGVANTLQYAYAVTAVDAVGNESPASAVVTATPADTSAPDVPQGLTAAPAPEQVTLRWSEVPGAAVYRVYRSATSPVVLDAASRLPEVTGTELVDRGRTNGVALHYVVTSVDAAGNESAASAEATATPTAAPDVDAPAAPAGVTASAGDAQVTLAWTAGTEADLAGYRVFRSAVAGGERTAVSGLVRTAGHVDTTVANGTTYHYVVQAEDLAGNLSATSQEVSATPADTTAPAVPAGLTATPGTNSVTLRWDANTEADFRRYRVYRATGSTTVPLDEAHLLGDVYKNAARLFLDGDLEAGTAYSYVLVAQDVLGNTSAATSVVTATPAAAADTTPPPTPTGLTATVAGSSVQLSWTAVTAADLKGYVVSRTAGAGSAPVVLTATPVTATTYTDTTAPAGAASTYTVTAVDTSNNASAPSAPASATPGSAAVDLKVDFQTDAAPVPAGYTKDIGAAYTAASGMGWITQDSLAAAERTPLDLRTNTRLRTRTGIDPRLNTILHMQYGDVVPAGTNGNRTAGAWERAVPNGRYTVLVSAGDEPGAAKTGCPAPCYDSRHVLRVEGVTALDLQATAAEEYRSGTVTVDVTDGKLTVDALGGTNTKINYLHVTSAGPATPDTTAPGAPGGLAVSPGDGSASLSWSRPADADVVGYHVYRAPSSMVQPQDKITPAPVSATSTTDAPLTNGTAYWYAVTAVDAAGNESELSAAVRVVPAAGAGVTVKVDFQNEASTPAPGYLADWGQAYGPRSSANQGTGSSYGWVNVGASTPLSLVGNGRNRNTDTPSANQPDQRLATMLHMQYAGGTMGVPVPGSWEMAVPNGAYTVTVALGDAGPAIDSAHWVNVENQNAVAQFVPTAGTKFATATRTVVVSDGRLTLSPAGGTNTKIAYVDVASLDRQSRPYTAAVTPGNGAVSVVTNAAPTSDNQLNAVDGAVDETTLGGGNVTLTRVSDGVRVPGTGSTSGGGDTVSFKADAVLAAGTLYRFDITAGVKDKGGRAFLPFSSVFTTATSGGGGGGTDQPPGSANAAFDKVDSGAAPGGAYTSLVMGPDGKLYAGSILGQITRWTVAADGTLTAPQVINTVRTHATARGWEGAPNRTIIGMVFDPASTPTNPVLWITDNYAYLGPDVPNATGAIAKLSGPDLEDYQEVVVNLPRSIKDHETNSLAWKDGKLLIQQGSMNAMGATDGTWKKPENLLSAAMLELDPGKLGTLPLDAATPDLNRPTRLGGQPGSYDPYAPGAPLTLYATGIRNAYDLVVHSNGHVYSGTNGSAAGGNTPATPTPMPASCARRPDGGYAGPSAPAITNNRQSETDYVFDVKRGKYYGHPNPLRCEWILNAGNPTGYTGNPLFKVDAYPLGQLPDPNYDLAGVYDAGLHASANGSIEYKNTSAFGGKFAGKLVVVRYSANQEIVAFDVAADGSLSRAITGITGFTGLRQPLDVVEDVATGNLYVTELTNDFSATRIVLLKPQGGSTATPSAQVTERLVFTETAAGTASAVKNVEVKNVGGGPLTVTGLATTGTDAAQFAVSGGPQLPATVPAGGTLLVPVAFGPAVPGPRGAALEVTSNDPRNPKVSTVLRGLGVIGQGGSNEPSLQWILDTLQIPVDVGDPDKTNNGMPDGPLLGEEVAVDSFTKAAFDQVVELEPLALFGPAGPAGLTATIGAHSSANPAERTVLLRGPNSSNQQVLPAMTEVAQFDEETPFGFDVTWHGLGDRVTYSEDRLNTWTGTAPRHKVRVYPMKRADGTVEPNAYLIAPEDVPTGVDYQDAVFVARNVKPAATAGEGKISASVPELVFSGVKGTTSAVQEVVVRNGGTSPLVLNAISATGPAAAQFQVTGAAQTLPAGGTATVQVRFTPGATTVGPQHAALSIASDDTATPVLEVGLHGLAANGEQGSNEPPLAQVVDVLGRKINVGGTGLILGTGAAPIGDEVVAPLFVKAGTAPVTMKPVARYSPDELLPFGWYEPNSGEPVHHPIASIALDQEQTLNPAVAAGGASTFDPGSASFGFFVDSKSFGRKSYTQDGINTNIPHAVRTYPAKDRAGAAIPGTYLVTFEDAQNGDYQDYVFEVSGVRPASASGPGAAVARVDFQPATSTVATGYTADTGLPFDAARGSGWLNAGRTAGLDMTALTRDRAGTTEARLRTLVLMQPTPAQSAGGDGVWELALANGTYTVTASVGDPGFTDSVHALRAEGQTVVAPFTPTTAVPSRTGTATVQVTDGRLTLDAVGGTNTKLQYVDVDRVETGADTTAPVVTAVVTGLQGAPGTYKNSATVTVTASDAGSGVASTSYSLDGGAFLPYTAPVEVTTAGSHTVRARAQDVAGNVTTTPITAFSVVAAGASRANVVLENADGVPFADRLVMNRIQNPVVGEGGNVVHDVAVLRVRNTGTEALNVTGLPVTGPFALVSPTNLPALVQPGGILDVPVRFTATALGTAGGLWNGTLTVATDDADEPSLPVELAGFWQSVSEGGQEPDVTEIARLFGYRTAITSAGVPLNQNGLVAATGDEVLSPYWLRANATQPVSVRQLAAFHTQGNTATARWFAKGSTTMTNLVTHAGVEGQSILPHRSGSTTAPASATFAPTTAFGFNIDGESSDPTKNNQVADTSNGCAGPCGHHVRFWPVRDRSGAIVPNTYLMGMDYSGINYDYNDNVYLVSNLKPETAVDPAAPAPLPGAAQLALGFDTTYPGTLVDKDGQTTGFGSTQPNRLDRATGSSSYDRTLLDVDTAAPGTLRIASSGTATAGTNGAGDNTLVNGLQNTFDATGDDFSVTGRVLGALTALDAGSEQQAVMFGPSQDDFVKIAAINRGGVPGIELYAEQGGAGVTVGTPVILPAGVTVLDLALLADPSARTVRGAYRVADGTWNVLPTALTLPATNAGRFFDRAAKAGVLVSHKGGAPFTATWDSFAVAAGDVTGAAAPAGQALHRLDVAGPGTYTDTRGQVWTPDTGRFTPATAPVEGAGSTQEIAGTQDDVLYRTYRGNVGNVPQDQRVLSYALPTRAATTVDVRLHFAERSAGNGAVGKRVFDIEVEGKVVRSGFDVFAAAGALNTAVVLPVKGVAVRDGKLDLVLRASADYPSIAAIEVLCQGTCPVDTTAPAAPAGLTATAGASGVVLDWADGTEGDLLGYRVYRSLAGAAPVELTAQPVSASAFTDTTAPAATSVTYTVVAVDSSENASPASSPVTVTTAAPPVQQPVRINAGGPAQTVGTTTWAACSSLTACSGRVSGGQPYSEADTITGIPAGMNNAIFQSEWTGGAARGARAFGFDIPVQNGRYDVRLHFAELNKTAAGTRVFSVDLEGARVLTDLDLFVAAGGIDKAIVRQFTTTVTDGRVTIDFLAGVENAKVSAIEVLPLDTTAPAQVTGVTATGSETGIALGWGASAATDLAGYHVYRAASPTGTYTRLTTALLTGTAYTDATAPAGATSSYQVTAVDRSGNESVRSATASAPRPGDTTPPAVVTGVTATGTATGVTVGWTASTAPDLAGYRVSRSTAGGAFAPLGTDLVTGTSFADTTAPEGVALGYQVVAVDAAGNASAASATATATRADTTAPAAVTGVTATGSAAGVTVGWAASSATDLAGYRVLRSATPTGTFTALGTALVTGTSYVDATAPEGIPVSYRVVAVDTAGNTSAVSATVTATRPDATAPAAVTGVTATGSAAGVTVGWAASSAPDLAGYHVYRGGVRLTTAPVTGTAYSDTAAPVGTSGYQVTAVDTAGNESARSATASATRPPATATAIRVNTGGPAVTTGGVAWSADQFFTSGKSYTNPSVTAIAGTTDDVLYLTERSALVNGGTFGYAVPVANGTYDVRLHFAELYWGATGGGPGGTGRRVFNVNLEGGTVELPNLDLNAVAAPMTAVVRTVRMTVTDGVLNMAFNASVDQPKVSAFEVLPADTTAPAAVTGVTAAAAPTGVTLGWAASAAADLAGYRVYRASTPTGAGTRLTPALLTGTAFTDAGAPSGVASYYTVTAVDRAGNESARSAVVSATRPAPAQRPVRINAGGPAQTVGGITWSACTGLAGCSGWVTGGFSHTEADTITGVPAGMNQALFRSEWTGGSTNGVPAGARAFGYDVPVANGAYRVRLHFTELNKTGPGQRVFDVRLEGAAVLTRFDVFAAAGGIDRVVTREFPVTITDGKVTLDFIRQVQNAKVSAIEILPGS